MAFLDLNEECAKRWPFMLFVLIGALLFLAVVLLFPSVPTLAGVFCIILFAGEWSGVLKARLTAVGLPHSRWMILLYGLLVYIACALLFFLFSMGRFLTPGLFVLLNLPLAFVKDKSSGAEASSLR